MITTDLRLAVQANGYAPIPCNGKVPAIPAWQNTADASSAEIARWTGTNTGVLTAFTPAIDIDITDPAAATVAEDTAKELFSDRGKVPVRFGRLPKRTLPFRCMAPFPKMSASFKAPGRDEVHKVEILGDGQQFVIDGIHPDTNEPYTWHGGTPWNTPRDELAEVTEADMQAYLELVAERLAEEFGWERVYTNGHGGARAARQVGATQLDVARPVDVDTRLEAMQFGGAGENAIHPTQVSVTASLLRAGLAFDETVRTVLEATKAAVARDARAQNWDWDEEELGLERMVASFISKNYELAHLLPDGLREAFQQKIGRGAYLVYRRDRGWQAHAQRGMGDRRLGKLPAWIAEARDGADDIDEAGKAERPKARRFRLVPFGELRPGPEPLYLVDELIPVAGLVDVWGKAKCFKSFWTLDLMLHVAMGWEYRDRYVRQGAVVYCAFEGAHGYKKRIEALRRHYGIAEGAVVPLYVMPGQANLIAEHRLLISDIAEQLEGVTPCAVVLDTLNKSLVGSENKDVDMGAYVRAAEAIRDKFGCVVIIVHHCGYDDTRPRGHSSLPGAVDAQLAVVRQETVITITVEMMRDGPEDTQVVSAVQVIEVGEDQNGKTLTSLVVVPSDADAADGHSGWPRGLRVFYGSLKAALAGNGVDFQPEAGALPVRAVSQAVVRERFYKTYADAEDDEKKRSEKLKKAFQRALGDAQSQGLIRTRRRDTETMIWLPEKGSL